MDVKSLSIVGLADKGRIREGLVNSGRVELERGRVG